MAVIDDINELARQIPTHIVDFNAPRVRGSAPTQASSEFITNREQGDWAERLILQAINHTSSEFVAVQYGRSDQFVAGEPGFEQFYQSYQNELDTIGKRPDLLIFRTADYDFDWSFNISRLPREILDKIVPRAMAGLEVRSSSFLIGHYDKERDQQLVMQRARLFALRDELINDFAALVPDNLQQILLALQETNLAGLTFRIPPRADEVLVEKLKTIRELRDKIHKTRSYLSFTAKVEDLYVVHKWVNTYGVPHFYFQVFFDRVYGISFEHILRVVATPNNEGKRFTVERNTKNQFKTTIHLNVKEGHEVAYKVTMPQHRSVMKQLPRGRLLFHVTFEGGEAFLNLGTLYNLLQLSNE